MSEVSRRGTTKTDKPGQDKDSGGGAGGYEWCMGRSGQLQLLGGGGGEVGLGSGPMDAAQGEHEARARRLPDK